MSPKDDREALEYARMWSELTWDNPQNKGHDRHIRSHVKLLSATLEPHPTCTFSLRVPESLVNRMGTLHGGAVALIFDDTTTVVLALVASPSRWQMGGVSRTLNCSYVRPAPLGAELVVKTEIEGGVGGRLAYLRGTMRMASTGDLVAVCEHHKVNMDPPAKL